MRSARLTHTHLAQDLAERVHSYRSLGLLDDVQAGILVTLVREALDELAAANRAGAADRLRAFIDHTNGYAARGSVQAPQACALITLAELMRCAMPREA